MVTKQKSPKTHSEDALLTLSQVAEQLGKTRTTIQRWCNDGLLTAIRMPSGVDHVRQSEVNVLLNGSAIDGMVSGGRQMSQDERETLDRRAKIREQNEKRS